MIEIFELDELNNSWPTYAKENEIIVNDNLLFLPRKREKNIKI